MTPDFHVDTAELPAGTVAIEASAGTGKTYALSHLAARFVAEGGRSISQLLIVTFTNAAAAELRERVRGAIKERSGAEGVPEEQRERLVAALSEFDTATITTIHGFCQQVLARLGVAAPGDPDDAMVPSDEELIRWTCLDLLTREAVATTPDPGATLPALDALVTAVKLSLEYPDAALVAGGTPEDDLLIRLVREGAARVAEERRSQPTCTFDQQISRVRELVDDDSVVAVLRERFEVALIDEFQDTDPAQWHIFSRIFGQAAPAAVGPATLVLVGDPKQAIYGFRGADVATYLDAVSTADARYRLGTNRRSTRSLVAAMNALLDGGVFGIDAAGPSVIPYEQVDVPEGAGDGRERPVAVRVLTGDTKILAAERDRRIVEDLIGQIARLRSEGVDPGAMAVLVRSNGQAITIQRGLSAAGVPAVLARAGDVYSSPAAAEWRQLLLALDRPARSGLARAAALGWFLGDAPEEVIGGSDEWLADVQQRLASLAETCRTGGAGAVYARLLAGDEDGGGLAARLLARPDGERNLTDAEHLAELLHNTTGGGCPPATLLEVLANGTSRSEEEDDAAKRRVEVDSGAVRIATIHTSKGLEYRHVFCPYLSERTTVRFKPTLVRTEEGALLVLTASGRTDDIKKMIEAEERAQDRRLLYVAVTRAKERLVLWWNPWTGAKLKSETHRRVDGSLAHVLWSRMSAEDGARLAPDLMVAERAEIHTPLEDLEERLGPVLERCGGGIEIAAAGEPDPSLATGPTRGDVAAEPPADREDAATPATAGWPRAEGGPLAGRWSFTRLTADDHEEPVPTLGGDDAKADDETGGTSPDADAPAAAPTPSAWDRVIGGGTSFGTLVHDTLEHADLGTTDLDAALTAAVRAAHGPEDAAPLVYALRLAVTTPLGPDLGDRRLVDLPVTDTLRELRFELPLGAVAPADVVALARLLGEHEAALGPYRVEDFVGTKPGDKPLVGILNGSIDLVARVPDPRIEGGGHRYWVMDYKTNRLPAAADGDPYHPDHLPVAMANHRYPLQALLYLVGLHRYLRWRLRGYDPAVHLGGSAYLFLRGMAGADTARSSERVPAGVAIWTPPAELIEAVSALLHRGVEREAA